MPSLLEHFAPLTDVHYDGAPQKGVHVYHFAQSSCSQLVRTAFAFKGVKFTSHVVNLALREQLCPAYVKLNPRGVVPTLVVDGKVTTDSLNIVKTLDSKFPGTPLLVPEEEDLKEAVLEESDMVDSIPLFPVTFGNCHYPSPDKRPFFVKRGAKSKAGLKMQVQALLKANKDDEQLRDFYEKRLEKANESSDVLSDENVKAVVDDIVVKINKLEQVLDKSETFQSGGFLFTPDPSLADIMWSYVLNRFAFLNLDQRLWKDGKHPQVQAYAERLFAMHAFKQGVRSWENPLWIGLYILRSKLFGFTIA